MRFKKEIIPLIVAIFGIVAAIIAFFPNNINGLYLALIVTITLSIIIVVVYNTIRYWTKTIWENRGRQLFKNLSKPDYLKWQQEILEKLYKGLEIATVYERRYPAAILRPSSGFDFPYATLCKLMDVKLRKVQINKKQRKYLKMLGSSLKWPEMKGFALKRLQLDANGNVKLIEAITSNFRQNVVTTHILEWELLKMYEKRLTADNFNLHKDLPFRANYHNGREGQLAILEPFSAYPLISLQAMVVYKNYKNSVAPNWQIVIAKRSTEVIVKPGFLQFQPAGGFEVYGEESDEDELLVTQGFDLKTAMFREFAEELFDAKYLQHRPDGRDPQSVLSDPNIQKLLSLIKSKKAFMDYLGVVVDLSVLRHELSFLIVIDDKSFCQDPLLGSWEAKNVLSVPPRELQSFISRGTLHSSSAALLQLAIESQRLIELGISKELMLKKG